MSGCLIMLPLLDEQNERRLDRFLEFSARERDRKGLKELYRQLSSGASEDFWPESPAQLFGTTKSAAYKMFTVNAASEKAKQRTQEWSEAVLREPALTTREAALIDLVSADWKGGGGWVFKAGLVLGGGVQPIEATRTYTQNGCADLIVNALKRLKAAGHLVPILTTRPDHALVEHMLNLAVRSQIHWTGRLSSQFVFPPWLSVKGLTSAPMQTLGVADILAASESTQADGDGSFAWLRINEGRYFVLYGPSRLGRYYLRSVGTRTAKDVQAEFLRLVEKIESRELRLTNFAIERLKVLQKNSASYERLTRGILWLWRFALQAPSLARPLPAADDEQSDTFGELAGEN